ncbi:hypothetical protein BACPEC_01926 [[Bacteroides] pectinophilus ATCC 43243]|uniref:Uncharacterized protein n=1 Tax=[Bacteroides] pectinophilus ATCC 43243 TaxID=483218 RepID=B7AS71_9FIRM|nr:hypothetical protein BACPEC_01926 [[Bacteroides] pectinophilus ATCC 43243]
MREPFREGSSWCKLLMEIVHEDHSRAVRRRNQGMNDFEALPCSCVISQE